MRAVACLALGICQNSKLRCPGKTPCIGHLRICSTRLFARGDSARSLISDSVRLLLTKKAHRQKSFQSAHQFVRCAEEGSQLADAHALRLALVFSPISMPPPPPHCLSSQLRWRDAHVDVQCGWFEKGLVNGNIVWQTSNSAKVNQSKRGRKKKIVLEREREKARTASARWQRDVR